ncbi:unnamed protein product [Prorocentrum cordatum]|uniref:Uncharacterized protein n=1 Tax=Prorocentrum cordatum TaxID=2364126 RepID=A0ABN9T0L5_9DINO|nr:unnamed protein product [Polarella glacialis]
MQLIIEELADASLTVKLRQGPMGFWDATSLAVAPSPPDDEAFLACASNSARLDNVIETMLEVISSVYGLFALEMSVDPKKGEAFLKYRGGGCTAARAARPIGSRGEMLLRIPGADPPTFVRVVNQYKHLDSVVTDVGNLLVDAKHRKSDAMQAYTPVCSKILGSSAVPVPLKI